MLDPRELLPEQNKRRHRSYVKALWGRASPRSSALFCGVGASSLWEEFSVGAGLPASHWLSSSRRRGPMRRVDIVSRKVDSLLQGNDMLRGGGLARESLVVVVAQAGTHTARGHC